MFDNIFDIQMFADGDETDTSTTTPLYDLDDVMTVEHGIKVVKRTSYLLDKKLGKLESATEGNILIFDSDGGVTDSGSAIATNEEFLAVLNEFMPISPNLVVDSSDVTIVSGENAAVNVTRLGDGAITVETDTALEGVTFAVEDSTITFTNASAIAGTGVYIVKVAGTDIFNPETTTINVTGASAG